jgi:GNAT superfamily N-acetyltransferase
VELRVRRDDDLDELVAVAGRVKAVDNYPILLRDNDFVRFLTKPTPVAAWVAILEGRLAGHVALNAETSAPVMRLAAEVMPAGRAIYVARLLVEPETRRQGAGRTLLGHACRAAIELGRVPLLDVVDTPAAAAAISLYRREGWTEVGRVSFYEDIDELVFRGPAS